MRFPHGLLLEPTHTHTHKMHYNKATHILKVYRFQWIETIYSEDESDNFSLLQCHFDRSVTYMYLWFSADLPHSH